MINIVKIIFGLLIGVIAIQFWIGFFIYSRLKKPPQMATVIQMHILTITALGLLFGGSLWFVPLGILFWFLSITMTPNIMIRNHNNPAKARNLSFALPFIYAMLFSYSIARHHEWELMYTLIGIIIAVFVLKKITEIAGAYFYFRK